MASSVQTPCGSAQVCSKDVFLEEVILKTGKKSTCVNLTMAADGSRYEGHLTTILQGFQNSTDPC